MRRTFVILVVAAFVLLSLMVNMPAPIAPAVASVAPAAIYIAPAPVLQWERTAAAVPVAPAIVVAPEPEPEPVQVVVPEPEPAQPVQQQTTEPKADLQTYFVLISLKAQSIFPQYYVNLNGYGQANVRDVATGDFLIDIPPTDRMRLWELAATGR